MVSLVSNNNNNSVCSHLVLDVVAGFQTPETVKPWLEVQDHPRVILHVSIHAPEVSASRNVREVWPEGLTTDQPGHTLVDTVTVAVVLGLLAWHAGSVESLALDCLQVRPSLSVSHFHNSPSEKFECSYSVLARLTLLIVDQDFIHKIFLNQKELKKNFPNFRIR